jgi:hypothetical protein
VENNHAQFEIMTEAELMSLAYDKTPNENARFVLGKLMIEGSSPKVAINESKGLNLIKDSAKAGNIDALEYKTYHDIRFDARPQLDKILKNL